jgi:hypothetical protein
MSVIETVLVYGVIPLAVVVVLAVVTLLPGRGKEHPTYRPGQPWTAPPVWYEPHPDTSSGADHGAGAPADGHGRPGLGATATALAIGQHPHTLDEGPRRTAAGGARGTW